MVLNDDALNLRDILSEVAKKVNIEGTKILHIYDEVLNGFAISVPNERVIEVLEQSPFVDYIEKGSRKIIFSIHIVDKEKI